MPKKTAVYSQCTSDETLERRLVEIVLLRELFLEQVVSLASQVKDKLKPLDEVTTCETLDLLSRVRSATIELILQIALWQKKYTNMKRPVINGGDYMLKFMKSVEFANTLAIKRTFNFQIGRGNIFMLPLTNAKRMPSTKITERVNTELNAFTTPDIDKMIAAMAVLKRSLPKKLLAEVMPLEHWLANRWVPSVTICTYFLTDVVTLPKIKKKEKDAAAKAEGPLPPAAPDTSEACTPLSPLRARGISRFNSFNSKESAREPMLQRMNSNMSVLSQLSDASSPPLAPVLATSSAARGPLSRLNSHDSMASGQGSKKSQEPQVESLEAIVQAPPVGRMLNTLAMRNWFVATMEPELGKQSAALVEEEEEEEGESESRAGSSKGNGPEKKNEAISNRSQKSKK